MTATQLFSLAQGKPVIAGPEQCALCGGSCDASIPVTSVLSDSFTDWQHVHGDHLCASCLLTLRADERADQPRLYSWVLTEKTARKLTKANLAELRATCLNPPAPPYCIVLAESGQRHLLYRAGVIHDSIVAGAYLEGEQIEYVPEALAVRLDLCGRIVAATAKSALDEFDATAMSISLSEYWTDWTDIFERWCEVRDEPLSRLAGFLCENRVECQLKFPSDTPNKKRKEKTNAGNPIPTSSAVAGQADPGQVPSDHCGPDKSGGQTDGPGLFG